MSRGLLSPVFREPLAAALPRLHAFAFLATGTRDAARRVLQVLVRELDEVPGEVRTVVDSDKVFLVRLTGIILDRLGRKAEGELGKLEDLLRTDVTLPVDVDAPPVFGDRRRLSVLEGELQRACLAAVLSALSPHPRLIFLLVDVLGCSRSFTAEVFKTTTTIVGVNLSRARTRLADYLGPRCRHLEPGNFCSCAGRLGVALQTGFVCFPPNQDPPPPTTPVDGPGALVRRLLSLQPPSLESLLESPSSVEATSIPASPPLSERKVAEADDHPAPAFAPAPVVGEPELRGGDLDPGLAAGRGRFRRR